MMAVTKEEEEEEEEVEEIEVGRTPPMVERAAAAAAAAVAVANLSPDPDPSWCEKAVIISVNMRRRSVLKERGNMVKRFGEISFFFFLILFLLCGVYVWVSLCVSLYVCMYVGVSVCM